MFACLDTSIVSTALVSVSAQYHNYQDTPWLVLGYLLTYMSETPSTLHPLLSPLWCGGGRHGCYYCGSEEHGD